VWGGFLPVCWWACGGCVLFGAVCFSCAGAAVAGAACWAGGVTVWVRVFAVTSRGWSPSVVVLGSLRRCFAWAVVLGAGCCLGFCLLGRLVLLAGWGWVVAADVVRVPASVRAKVQLCIRAAELRVRHARFVEIARELGLPDAATARRAVEEGLALVPSEDVRAVRRLAADELHAVGRSAWGLVDDPGPATTVSGKVIIDPGSGEPYPDNSVRVAALGKILEVNKELRKLHGADAPKQSMSVVASMSAEEIRSVAAQVMAQARDAEREVTGFGGPAELPAGGPGSGEAGGRLWSRGRRRVGCGPSTLMSRRRWRSWRVPVSIWRWRSGRSCCRS